MKKILFLTVLFTAGLIMSCNNELIEVPKDFYSPENSFTNKAGFESALAHIWLSIRTDMYARTGGESDYDLLGMDLDIFDYEAHNNPTKKAMFQWNAVNSDNAFSQKWWSTFYKWISYSNTIIDRADQPTAVWATEAEKNEIVANAKFLRAFAYHFLANMWGGVPLVLNETTTPKFDYVRASQTEVYQQCKADLEFAVQYMVNIDAPTFKGGKAPKEAAYHLLTEVNICLKDYDGAIAAASSVIDGGKLSLMQNRFGKWKNFTYTGYDWTPPAVPWGDVYFDLFQDGNYQYKDGNKETIWNLAFDLNIKGGGGLDVSVNGGIFAMSRYFGPGYWLVVDKDGKSNWLKDTLNGRPIGFFIPTDYVQNQIWNYKGDFDKDIRNSEYNVQRTFYWTNPASKYYRQPITPENSNSQTISLWEPRLTPHFKKFVRAVPLGTGPNTTSDGKKIDNGFEHKDWYVMRLAETYLLRAEAYMLKGDNAKAADDINVIRNRAQATPVVAGDVNMDLILAERARELLGEEFRINTLMRTGKLVEYLRLYNGFLKVNNFTVPDHVNLLPIPRREIEANKEAVLEQNPGYN